MSDEHHAERAYVITYPDDTGSSPHPVEPPLADGTGEHGQQPFLLETRERLAHVESQVGQVADSVDRIEDKVDDVADEVSEVDDGSLDTDRFNNHFAEQIRANTRIRAIARWVGITSLGLGGVFGGLNAMGLL